MRLSSEFFISATIRRAELGGAFAALRRRGGAQSGAIFVVVDRLDGTCTLYGPAPQSLYEGGDSERAFTRLHNKDAVTREMVETRLDKEIRFDPDIWILEIEARDGQSFLDRIL